LIKDNAQRGKLDAIEPEYYLKYYSTLKNIAKDHMQKPADLPNGTRCGLWYYGKTGAGKTHAAIEEFPDHYRKIAANKWWDGYREEPAVIIDDFDKKHDYMGYNLKIWADHRSFIAEIKGGAIYVRPKTIIVTSNYHPRDIWDDPNTVEPILRRFKIVEFKTLAHSIGLDHPADEVREHWSFGQDKIPAVFPDITDSETRDMLSLLDGPDV